MSKSELETTMLFYLRANNYPQPETEYRFHPKRKWRFDMAWPDEMLAVEIEGGVWSGGRHTTGAGFIADCQKYNEATLLGWRIIRVTSAHIENGAAIDWIRRALREQAAEPPPF